jgi:hypothetical protein
MGTSIDRFLARTGSRDARPDVAPAPPLGMAVDLAPPDPVRSARILKAQATSGLSGDIVDRQLDQIEHHEQQQRFNPPVFEQATPITAAWLAEDPHHIAVAQDDLPALSYLERQFRHVKDQFQAGRATTTLTDIGTAAILGRVSPEQRAEQAALEHEMGSHVDYGIGTGHEILHRFGPLGDAIAAAFSATPAGRLATKAGQLVEQTPGYVANQVPIFGQTMKGKVIGAGVGAAGGALVGAATGPGALATAGAGATMGWRVGGIPAAAQMEAALAYLDYEKIKDDRGLPLDRRAAVGAALVTGAVNGALEAFSFETVAKSIPGLRSLGRDGMRQLLAKETSRSAIESALKHIGESATTEGSTEFLQEYVTNLSGRIVQLIQEGKPLSVGELLDRTVLDPQFFAQAVESAKGGALGGGGIAAAGGVLSLAQTPTRIRKAEQMTRVFQALGDGAEDSKLLERLPEKMQDVVTRMTANGPLEHVYAPVEQFTEYFQGVGLDPADVAEEIFGSRDQYEEALRTGQDLAIPTARYAVTIAPTEHNAFFADELRFSPTDMNAREAREAAAQLDADEQQQRDAEAPAADAAAAVGESVTSQLVGAGFDEQTASTYATLLESTFRTLGQRTGTDPKALFDRFGLTIARRESPDAPAPRAPIDTEAIRQRYETNRAAALIKAGKESDEDGGVRFSAPRTPGGARRPVARVSTRGLLLELLELEAKRADAENRSVYELREDENLHTDGLPQIVATRKSGEASRQAKALTNLEGFQRIQDEVFAELAARGVDDTAVFDRMEDLRAELDERAGVAGDFDVRADTGSR